MNKLVVTMVLLFVSLNGYADCWDATPEEMSYYAYMTEEELYKEYCTCEALWKNKYDYAVESKKIGALEKAAAILRQAGVISDEQKKITRVLKKDYETEPKECKK